MRINVLGSDSKGNGYILQNDDEALLIEAGISFKEAKIALDFNVVKVVGVICTHPHFDHIKYIANYENAGIDVWRSWEDSFNIKRLGGFTIQSFDLPHDVPCKGFLIKHEKIGRMLFITDAVYCPFVFKNLDFIMVEANFDKDLIDTDLLGSHEYKSISSHMEAETALGLLKANNNPNLKGVMLLHLSDTKADPVDFKRRAEEIVDCPVYIARKGMEVKLNEEMGTGR